MGSSRTALLRHFVLGFVAVPGHSEGQHKEDHYLLVIRSNSYFTQNYTEIENTSAKIFQKYGT